MWRTNNKNAYMMTCWGAAQLKKIWMRNWRIEGYLNLSSPPCPDCRPRVSCWECCSRWCWCCQAAATARRTPQQAGCTNTTQTAETRNCLLIEKVSSDILHNPAPGQRHEAVVALHPVAGDAVRLPDGVRQPEAGQAQWVPLLTADRDPCGNEPFNFILGKKGFFWMR